MSAAEIGASTHLPVWKFEYSPISRPATVTVCFLPALSPSSMNNFSVPLVFFGQRTLTSRCPPMLRQEPEGQPSIRAILSLWGCPSTSRKSQPGFRNSISEVICGWVMMYPG